MEISITTSTKEPNEATKLENFAPYIEKYTVVAKGEAAKDFKIGTNTGMKKYWRCDKCGKYLFLIPALLNQRREKRSAKEKKPIECSKY